MRPGEVEQAADEAKAKLEAAAKATDEVEAAAQQAKSELQSAGGELVPEPLDTRTVDPEDFASKLPIDGGPELPPAPVVTVDEVNVREAGLDTGLEEALAFDAEEEWPGMDMPEESSTEDVLVLSHAPVVRAADHPGRHWALCHAHLRGRQDSYDGLREGRDDLSSADAFGQGYTVAPTKRTDHRFELEAWYGLNERWDLYAVLPFQSRDLDYDRSLGGADSADTSGLGDIQLGGVFRSYDVEGTRVSYLVGLNIPTGSIDERGTYAGTANSKLPYDLQLGTGTFELMPGMVFETTTKGGIQLGARAAGRIHLETENDEGWFPSNSARVDVWAGKQLADDLTGTVRLQGDWWGDLHNFDPELDVNQSPGEDSLRQGGDRVMVFGGLGYDLDTERDQRVQLEFGAPVDQWLDGPQLAVDWTVVLGWRVNF
ncbi:MAG: transporter [Planctomycetota bacterium]